jgi:hypothetical protein
MNQQTQVLLLYIRVGIAVLSARIVMLLALVLAFGLFAWAMAAPTYERIACATLFAILIFLPSVRLDARQSADRAVISPKDST